MIIVAVSPGSIFLPLCLSDGTMHCAMNVCFFGLFIQYQYISMGGFQLHVAKMLNISDINITPAFMTNSHLQKK